MFMNRDRRLVFLATYQAAITLLLDQDGLDCSNFRGIHPNVDFGRPAVVEKANECVQHGQVLDILDVDVRSDSIMSAREIFYLLRRLKDLESVSVEMKRKYDIDSGTNVVDLFYPITERYEWPWYCEVVHGLRVSTNVKPLLKEGIRYCQALAGLIAASQDGVLKIDCNEVFFGPDGAESWREKALLKYCQTTWYLFGQHSRDFRM